MKGHYNVDALSAMMLADTTQLTRRMISAGKKRHGTYAGISKRRHKIARAQKASTASLSLQTSECVTLKEGKTYDLPSKSQLDNHGFHTTLKGMHSALARALMANVAPRANVSSADTQYPVVPVSSAEHDSRQLEWGRSEPLCAAGAACEAAKLLQSQGPLHVYCPPTCDGKPAVVSDSNLCLLCIRLHAEMMCKELSALQPADAMVPSMLLPPFTNIVNAPGGYYMWSLGVSAVNHGLFDRQCSIVGASPLLTVKYSPLEKKWWVCQDKLVWQPSPRDFREGAQEKPT